MSPLTRSVIEVILITLARVTGYLDSAVILGIMILDKNSQQVAGLGLRLSCSFDHRFDIFIGISSRSQVHILAFGLGMTSKFG